MSVRSRELWCATVLLCLACGSSQGNSGQPSSATASSTTSGQGGNSAGATASGNGGAATSTSDAGGASTTGAVGGAGTGGSAGSTDSPLPVTPTGACLEYLRGYCEFVSRCKGPSDVAQCFEANASRCPDLAFAPGSTRTVEGTVACADAWRALQCDGFRPDCSTPGTREVGEPCVSGFQCASRLCSDGDAACGECLESLAEGEACDPGGNVLCEPGLECDATDLVCRIPEPGSTPGVGGLELDEECDPGSSGCYPNDCRQDSEGTYRCQPYPTLGEDCSVPLTCAFGTSYCDISQVCLAFPGEGQPCGVDGFTGRAQWCAEGLSCDASADPAVCVVPARAGPNEDCSGACQEGLSCRCQDAECSSRLCQRTRFPGDSCSAPEDVCLASDCMDAVCVAPDGPNSFETLCGE